MIIGYFTLSSPPYNLINPTHYGNSIDGSVYGYEIPMTSVKDRAIFIGGQVSASGDNSIITSGAHQTTISSVQQEAFISKFEVAWVWEGNGADTLWTNAQNWKNGSVPPTTFFTNDWGYEVLPDVYIKNEKVVIPSTTPWPVRIHHLTIDYDNAQLVIRPTGALQYEGRLNPICYNTANYKKGLILRSDVNNTAQLLGTSDMTNLPGTVERYLLGHAGDPQKGWHFLSSPLSNHPISPFDNVGGTDDFYKWSEQTQEWINRTDAYGNLNSSFETNFVVGRGYLIAKPSSVNLKFESAIPSTFINNTANVSVSGLTKSTGTYSGWNFIGNPFPCPVIWHDPGNGINWSLSNIDNIAQIWIGEGASYQLIQPGDHIPSTCGFMVRVNNTSGGSLNIPHAAKHLEPGTHFYQKSSTKLRPDQILLTARDLENDTWQQTVIGFNDNATESYDSEYDSYFLAGYAPQFYSIMNNERYALNTLPALSPDLTLPMGFKKNNSKKYAIELTYNTTPAPQIYLTDLKTNQTVELTKNSYIFDAAENDPVNRFVLHFKSSLGIPQSINSPVRIIVEGKQVNIIDAHPYKLIQVYDLNGKHLLDVRNDSHESELSFNMPFSQGVYFLKFIGDKLLHTEKVVLWMIKKYEYENNL